MFKEKFNECVKLFYAGDINNASVKARDLINFYPDSYELNNLLGLIYAQTNNLNEAYIFFNKCSKI